MNEAFVYDAIRTPRGKGKKDGSLHEVKPISLLSGVLRELQSRNQFAIVLKIVDFYLDSFCSGKAI